MGGLPFQASQPLTAHGTFQVRDVPRSAPAEFNVCVAPEMSFHPWGLAQVSQAFKEINNPTLFAKDAKEGWGTQFLNP